MKTTWLGAALLMVTFAGIGEAAAPAPAPKPAPAPAEPVPDRWVMARAMPAVSCSTDGGPVGCSDAVRFLGSAFVWQWRNGTEGPRLTCGPEKRPELKVKIMYEYNEGTWELIDTDAKKAKWPACIREKFPALATPMLAELWKKIHELDGSIDVRASWTLTLSFE